MTRVAGPVATFLIMMAACTTADVLDTRIPSVGPSASGSFPRLLITNDGVNVISRSRLAGQRVTTAVELRRLLVRLPVTDWERGRFALVNPPSLGPWGEHVEMYLRMALVVLGELGVGYQIISRPTP